MNKNAKYVGLISSIVKDGSIKDREDVSNSPGNYDPNFRIRKMEYIWFEVTEKINIILDYNPDLKDEFVMALEVNSYNIYS